MGTKRFYLVGLLGALLLVAYFSATLLFGPTAAKPLAATQPSAPPLAQVTNTVPADKLANPPENGDKEATDNPSLPQPGSNAIIPTNPTAGADTPAFTEQDVRNYVGSHYSKGFLKVDSLNGSPQITSIKFATLSALTNDLKLTLDVQANPNALMCAVTYAGKFVVSAPYGYGVRTFSHVLQVGRVSRVV